MKNLMLIFAMLITLMLLVAFESLNAQEHSPNIHSLLNEVSQRMTTADGFMVAITFAAPLSPESEIVWVLPDGRENDDLSRVISSIGDDHLCFDVVAGSARYIECTPFSNIVSIRYLVL